ncbi:hypothetical protein DSO57_1015692 [Entomophthora muscae]|uniref:Uncharacterized protein n=1 Tax=Entomophthora muscae TaxID=34485 RepID=A0ACC2RJU2_9FUNG|nr:hypothetical protein DSO57_1015692 [Entomophthora muscae]
MISVSGMALFLVQAQAFTSGVHSIKSGAQNKQPMSREDGLVSSTKLARGWTTLEKGVEKRKNVQANFIVNVTTPLLLDSSSLWVGGTKFTQVHLALGAKLAKSFNPPGRFVVNKHIFHIGQRYSTGRPYMCDIRNVCKVTIKLINGAWYDSFLQNPKQLSLSDIQNMVQHRSKWTRSAKGNYTYTFPGPATAELYFTPISFGVLQQTTTKDRYHLTSFHQETSVHVAPIKVGLFHDGFISIKVSNFIFQPA